MDKKNNKTEKQKFSERQQRLLAHIQKVQRELETPDPDFVKFKCPICHGYGKAQGAWANPGLSVGRCHFCGGSGVGRRRKRISET